MSCLIRVKDTISGHEPKQRQTTYSEITLWKWNESLYRTGSVFLPLR